MFSAIYWLVIRTYILILRIAALFNSKAKLAVAGRKHLLQHIRYALIDERRPRIWMHCASLGEFEQGRPLLEKLRKQYPQYAYIVTFFSPSGYEVRKDYEGADHIFYLPFDSAYNAKQFLKAVQPELAIFVKYEFWYFFLMQLANRNIPTILVSAIFRKDQAFFKWYGRLHKRMLRAFSHIFVQDKASEQLLHKAGIDYVTIAGDTRFDRVTEALQHITPLPQADVFCRDGKILVAGSTWPSDEVFLQQVLQTLPAHWKLILVPHEVNDSHIADIEKIFSGNCVKWTEWSDGDAARVLIVNKVGLLLALYKYADIAWVGGGFDKNGVHNVLEAAVYGIPVAFGPVYDQFLEAKELLASGGGISITDPVALKEVVLQSETDPYSYEQACTAARDYVLSKGGATRKIIDHLEAKKLLSRS